MNVVHRCYEEEQSVYSQSQHYQSKLYSLSEADFETNAGQPMATFKYDRLISLARQREIDPAASAVPTTRQPAEEPTIFFRRVLTGSNEPTPAKSLLSQSRIRKSDDHIRVYFFGGKQCRQYDRSEVEQLFRVKQFIAHVVEDFCNFFLGICPQKLDCSNFVLKLADLDNRHDALVEALDHSDEIATYLGQSLCLLRPKDHRSLILDSFKDAIKDNSEVIEVFVPSHNNTTLKIKIEPQRRFDFLLDRVFKMCGIVDSPNDYALVEFSTFHVNTPATLIRNIKERHFELLRSKPKSYDDMCSHPQHHQVQRTDTSIRFVRGSVFDLGLRLDQKNVAHIRSNITVDVERAIWQEKMRLSIENGELVERYERSLISRFMELVCEQEYQHRYQLITLASAFAEDNCLVLRFLSKKSNLTRRYHIAEPQRGIFLNEILRLCRVNKKSLTLPERSSR